MVASPAAVESTRRLGLVRRSPSFGLLFLATGWVELRDLPGGDRAHGRRVRPDGLGRLGGRAPDRRLPADRRHRAPAPGHSSTASRAAGSWWSRTSFVVGVFAALPFVDDPAAIVGLAGVAGVATGFFRPAVYAGLPNLVPDEELTKANSLLQTVETVAWMVGPVVGGADADDVGPQRPVRGQRRHVPRVGLARRAHPRAPAALRGVAHARALAGTSPMGSASSLVGPLRTVLVVWNVVCSGARPSTWRRSLFAKEALDAGTSASASSSRDGGRARVQAATSPRPRSGRSACRWHVRGLAAAHGPRLGRQRLRPTSGRLAARGRRRGGQRGRHRLEPAARAAEAPRIGTGAGLLPRS